MNFPLIFKTQNYFVSLKSLNIKDKKELLKFCKQFTTTQISNPILILSLLINTYSTPISISLLTQNLFCPDSETWEKYLLDQYQITTTQIKNVYKENPPKTLNKSNYLSCKKFIQYIKDIN